MCKQGYRNLVHKDHAKSIDCSTFLVIARTIQIKGFNRIPVRPLNREHPDVLSDVTDLGIESLLADRCGQMGVCIVGRSTSGYNIEPFALKKLFDYFFLIIKRERIYKITSNLGS